jgi:hypothetical protein
MPPSPVFIGFLLIGHRSVFPTLDMRLGEKVGEAHSEYRSQDEIPAEASLKTAGKRGKKKDGWVLLPSRLLLIPCSRFH